MQYVLVSVDAPYLQTSVNFLSSVLSFFQRIRTVTRERSNNMFFLFRLKPYYGRYLIYTFRQALKELLFERGLFLSSCNINKSDILRVTACKQGKSQRDQEIFIDRHLIAGSTRAMLAKDKAPPFARNFRARGINPLFLRERALLTLGGRWSSAFIFPFD